MKTAIIIIIIALAAIGIGYYFFGSNPSSSSPGGYNYNSNTSTPQPSPASSDTNASSNAALTSSSATTSVSATEKDFTVVGRSFSFSPSAIRVKKGDLVKITFKDEDGFHNLTIDGYNVKTSSINSGQEAVLTFTADRTGTFSFYCSVDSHREQGMQGTLTVE